MLIKLKVEHTHGGESYSPGAVLDVDKPTGEWLVKHRLGEPMPAAPAAVPAKVDVDKKESGK